MKKLIIIMLLLLIANPAYAEYKPNFEKLVDAIYLAEGGVKAKKPFGILSVVCHGYDHCRKIALNTVRNNWKRWLNGSHGSKNHSSYLRFLASRYAPVGVANDPNNLNKNWYNNVSFYYEKFNNRES